MRSRTLCSVLASLALLAAPLAAQDTTGAKPDTTARKDSVAVNRADTTGAAAAQAQAAVPTAGAVKPGMTVAEVEAAWGKPIAVRTANDWTYLFYRNGRERTWGYYDVVMLQHGQVMDAIVRAPEHVYAGVSSSPEGVVPHFTPPHAQQSDSTNGAAVTGVRVKPEQ